MPISDDHSLLNQDCVCSAILSGQCGAYGDAGRGIVAD
jgi:hypothetical protein